MNNLNYGYDAQADTITSESLSHNVSFTGSAKEPAYQQTTQTREEEKGFAATCEESYQMSTQILAFQMLNIDACYTL